MDDRYFWPLFSLILIGSAVFDWYVGAVRIGRFFEIDRDESEGAFIVLTGLKCVGAVLILMMWFSV